MLHRNKVTDAICVTTKANKKSEICNTSGNSTSIRRRDRRLLLEVTEFMTGMATRFSRSTSSSVC